MPYIKPEKRPPLQNLAEDISKILLEDEENIEGNLNYTVSMILNECLRKRLNYKNANALIGALECCKMEIYRRVVAKYEDAKIKQYGDVFDLNV